MQKVQLLNAVSRSMASEASHPRNCQRKIMMMGLSRRRNRTNGRRAERERCKIKRGGGKEGGGCGGPRSLECV